MVMQIPVNPKDWAMVGPVILGIVLLVIIGVWAVKQLGLTQNKGRPPVLGSGDLPESQWVLNITAIVQAENEKLRIRIKEQLEENFDEIKKAQVAILVLEGLVAEAERNILNAVRNNKSVKV
jgi:uncharacterized membrane protein YraQ (UPF0718 family)